MDKLPTSSMPVEGVKIMDSNSNVKTVRKSKKGSVGRWSDVEHKSYLEGVKKYGDQGDWERISEEYVPTRTRKQIHLRYLAKKHAKKQESTTTTDSNEQGYVLALAVPEVHMKKRTTKTEDKIPVPDTKGKYKAHMSGSSRVTKEPLSRSEPMEPSNSNLSVPFSNQWKSSGDNNMFPEVTIICSDGDILEEDPAIKNESNNVPSSTKQDLDPDQLHYVQDPIVLPTDDPVCFGESLENQSTVGDGVTSGSQVLNELRNMGAYQNSEVRLGQEFNYDSWPHGDEFKIL